MAGCYMKKNVVIFHEQNSGLQASPFALFLKVYLLFSWPAIIYTIEVIGPSIFFPTDYLVLACKIVGCHLLLLHYSGSSYICHQLLLYSSRFICYFLLRLFIHATEVIGPSMFSPTGFVPTCKVVGCHQLLLHSSSSFHSVTGVCLECILFIRFWHNPPPLFLAAFPFDFVLIAWLEGVLVVGEDCRIIVNGLSLRNPHVVVLLLLLTTLVASEGSEPQFLAGSPV